MPLSLSRGGGLALPLLAVGLAVPAWLEEPAVAAQPLAAQARGPPQNLPKSPKGRAGLPGPTALAMPAGLSAPAG